MRAVCAISLLLAVTLAIIVCVGGRGFDERPVMKILLVSLPRPSDGEVCKASLPYKPITRISGLCCLAYAKGVLMRSTPIHPA